MEGYHDADLVAVERIRDTVVLSFVFEEGDRKYLAAEGCRILRIDGFGLQNIVSRVFEPSTEQTIREALIKASIGDDGKTLLVSQEGLTQMTSDILSNKLILLVVEPSFGAEIVFVCECIREMSYPPDRDDLTK